MTLQKFTALTAKMPDYTLRRAIAAALANGVPHTPEEFARFHADVIDELHFAVCDPRDRAA